MRYDVIVVGAGAAGAVIARRLVEDGDVSVLLLEAGGRDLNPAIHEPSRLFELWFGPEDWAYTTVPQAHSADRRVHVPRGKVLGGSTCLNGMIYIRGWRGDFDHWAYLGNAGWGYEDVLPIFKRSEDFDGGESEYHGVGGPLRVMSQYEPHPLNAAFVAAAGEAGVPFNPDHNGPELDGAGFGQLMVKDGKRQSTAVAFLAPVLDRPNLTLLTEAPARRLLFEGERCVGVEFGRNGSVETAFADSEVVVSAGAIESPKLLLLSGIGAAGTLRSHGIEPVVELPGVGRNLHDHCICPTIYSSSKPVPPVTPGLTQLHSHLFWRSRPGLVSPDIQPLFFHIPAYSEEWMHGPEHGFTIMPGVIRPASRGTLELASADPDDPPLVDPAYLCCDADLEAMVGAFELCREIARQGPLREWAGKELYPGPEVKTEREIRDYIRRTTITYHHHVGTCRMGIDEEAVVDPELRVYGTTGLRVADASIMPVVTSGNTVAPSMMIGERAADLVKAALDARIEPALA